MTFESEGLYIVAIYIWLPPASYVVFLTTGYLLDTMKERQINNDLQVICSDLYVWNLVFGYLIKKTFCQNYQW